MGEIQNYRRLSREDFVDPPEEEWFDQFLNIMNRTLEDITSLLQGGLTLVNRLAETVTLDLTHNTALEIRTQVPNPVSVRVTKSATALTQPVYWEQKSDTSVEVTAQFSGAPTDPVECRLEIEG